MMMMMVLTRVMQSWPGDDLLLAQLTAGWTDWSNTDIQIPPLVGVYLQRGVYNMQNALIKLRCVKKLKSSNYPLTE